jgi:hypothetical protein
MLGIHDLASNASYIHSGGRFPFGISGWTSTVLTKDFMDSLSLFREMGAYYLQIGHNRFDPYPFQFVIH